MGRLGILFLALLLASCDQSANRVSTLWTNIPEMASAAETFNASQREWQLLVEYREDPAGLLTTPGVKADLVVARNLASSEVKNTLASLDFLFDGGNLAKASFYQHSLDAGAQGDRLKLLPLSFDLPVLLLARSRQPDLPGFSVSLGDLKALNTAFEAQPATKGFRRQAFSPRWGGFGTTFLQWSGTSFREGFQASLAWDTTLTESLRQYQSWSPAGVAEINDFQRKYLQADAAPALSAGRIQFYPSTLSSFANRPWQGRRDLDFRFLDQNGRVLASDIVWAGIPSSAMTRGAAERFLAWFFQASTQKRLVEETRFQDDRTFGLVQGLSSLTATNLGPLTSAYPELAGRLPATDQVVFPPTLPTDWPVLKATVVQPWLASAAPDEAGLKTALERHRAQAAQR